jgi:TRAP-type C4-dicarboxylate transport system permease small subunit
MKNLERLASIVFGATFLLLSLAISVETGLRKLANVSLQGVDELGGYCLAVGAGLAFAVALASAAHIRIDLVHDRLPQPLRVLLNAVAVVALVAVAAALAWMAWLALGDSIAFNSTAQTPWATPLKLPQGAWVAAMLLFVAIALVLLVRLLVDLLRGHWAAIDRDLSPRGSDDELEEELADLAARKGEAKRR